MVAPRAGTLCPDIGRGTGFWISERQLVTANHVLQDGEPSCGVTVEWPGTRSSASAAYTSVLTDLAILTLDAPFNRLILKLAERDAPRIGEVVCSGAYPRGSRSEAVLVCGPIVKSVLCKSGIGFQASLSPGFSGAPVVDSRGTVLGMVIQAGESTSGSPIACLLGAQEIRQELGIGRDTSSAIFAAIGSFHRD